MATVTAEILVKASIKSAYRAFTNSTILREWLCDVATVEPHPRGRMYLWWRGDFYSSGHFIELEENQRVKFRWYSNIDPAPTEVTVIFTEKDGGVIVRTDHEIPDDPAWKKMGETFRENWVDSLESLKSVLETGIDLRIANRPMLGIAPGDFTEEQVIALGVPVREGLDDLRAKEKAMFLQMSPLDAAGKGLKDGEPVTAFNQLREAAFVLKTTPRVPPGVVVAEGVWWLEHCPGKGSVNALTSQRLTDRGNGSTFYDNTVDVRQP